MDLTSLMLSLLFGMAGMGFVVYGKKAAQVIPMVAGLLLMVVPYFISSVMIMLIVCVGLSAAPFVIRGE
jgi:hypothetical protein